MQVVEAPVGDIAEVFEEALQGTILPLLDHEVDVAVSALKCRWKRAVPVHAHGRATQQPHQDMIFGRAPEQAGRLGFDVGEWSRVFDHSGHLNAHAGWPRVGL